jgi:hypothetical protein
MQGFIRRKNIENYRKLLAGPTLDEGMHKSCPSCCLTKKRRSRLYPKPGMTTNPATLSTQPSLTLRLSSGTVKLAQEDHSMFRADQHLASLVEAVAAAERRHFDAGMGATLRSINSEKAPTAEECAEFAAAEAAWNVASRKLADYQANQ